MGRNVVHGNFHPSIIICVCQRKCKILQQYFIDLSSVIFMQEMHAYVSTCNLELKYHQYSLSGRVLDSRSRGWVLVPHAHHCIVSLSKTY